MIHPSLHAPAGVRHRPGAVVVVGLVVIVGGLVSVGCERRPAPNVTARPTDETAEASSGTTPEKEARPARRLPAERGAPWRSLRDWTVAETAVDSLARIGKPSLPALVRALRHRDPAMRLQAARALARMGSDAADAVPDLVDALADRDEQVRKQVVRALGQIGPAAEEAIPALVGQMRDTSGGRSEGDR